MQVQTHHEVNMSNNLSMKSSKAKELEHVSLNLSNATGMEAQPAHSRTNSVTKKSQEVPYEQKE